MTPSYLDKKWTFITPLRTHFDAPPIDEPYSIDVDRCLCRLLRSNAYHIDYGEDIDMSSDIYIIESFDISNIEKEIQFAKKLKSLGKKIIVGFSADYRFLLGDCLISPSGTHFSELCKEVDVILSGMHSNVDIYGRYSHKVVDWGLPVERLNFTKKPYNEREIDILMSASSGEEGLALNMELALTLKEKYPDIRLMYSLQEVHKERIKPFLNKGIEFVHQYLIDNLVNSKVYINPEIRPRGGRAMLDAWYCRTPFIACDTTIYSDMFPEYAYTHFNIKNIVEIYDNLRNSNYNSVIQKAEKRVEEMLFENKIKELMNKLYKGD